MLDNVKTPVQIERPTLDVYVNFYQRPGSPVKTTSVHPTREKADEVWNPPKGGWPVSKKQRVACIRVSAVCIDGQFDL